MLASIARDEYGAEKYWSAIVEANPGLDPAKLHVGQSINLPTKDAVLKRSSSPSTSTPNTTNSPSRTGNTNDGAANSPTAPRTTPNGNTPTTNAPAVSARKYTVTKGDTLMAIARKQLKDGGRWKEIYDLNKDKLSSPNAIKEGMELKLPGEASSGATPASSRGNTRPANGTRAPERRPTTRPTGSPR